MNTPRKLKQNAWYKVGSEINIGEPLFRLPWTKVLLHRVLREIKKRYPFEMRGLRLEGAWLTFYIKPDDGLKLPKIMQWLKQTCCSSACCARRSSVTASGYAGLSLRKEACRSPLSPATGLSCR